MIRTKQPPILTRRSRDLAPLVSGNPPLSTSLGTSDSRGTGFALNCFQTKNVR